MSNIYKVKAPQYLMVHCLQGKRKAEEARLWRQERGCEAGCGGSARLSAVLGITLYV